MLLDLLGIRLISKPCIYNSNFYVTRSQAAVINKYLASVQPLSILFEVRSSCIWCKGIDVMEFWEKSTLKRILLLRLLLYNTDTNSKNESAI